MSIGHEMLGRGRRTEPASLLELLEIAAGRGPPEHAQLVRREAGVVDGRQVRQRHRVKLSRQVRHFLGGHSAMLAAMDDSESYSPAQRLAAWVGVAAAAGLLLICLDVATSGRLFRASSARYRWSVATSEGEQPG